MSLLYHAYVYLEFLILACTIYILAPHIFYRGEGCADCFNTGYRGRIGVFEILEITPEIRPLISQQAGRPVIEQELASAHSEFKTLRENAIQLVEEGITTTEEVQRVIYETGDMKKAEEE